MRKINFVFIILALVVILTQAFAQDDKTDKLSEEDIGIIQNLEILQEFDMLTNMDLSENYEAIKNMETSGSEGETNEENNS